MKSRGSPSRGVNGRYGGEDGKGLNTKNKQNTKEWLSALPPNLRLFKKTPLRLNKHQTQQYAHTALRPLLFCLGLALEAAYLRCNKSEGCSPTLTPSLHKSQDSANEVSLIMDRKKGPRRAGTSQTTIKRIIKNNNPPKGRRKKVIPFIHVCVCAYIYIHISHNI